MEEEEGEESLMQINTCLLRTPEMVSYYFFCTYNCNEVEVTFSILFGVACDVYVLCAVSEGYLNS